MSSLPTSREDGLTLVELLVTVAIIGISFLSIVGGMWTAIFVSDVHRKEATSETVLRAYAEYLKEQPWPSPDCPAKYPTAFPSGGYVLPAGYSVSVSKVEHWVAEPSPAASPTVSGFWRSGPPGGTCTGADTGLQRLTLEAASVDGRATETVQIVKRKP